MYSKTTYNPYAPEAGYNHVPLLDDEFDSLHETGFLSNRHMSHTIIID